jgi:hypothetical protein
MKEKNIVRVVKEIIRIVESCGYREDAFREWLEIIKNEKRGSKRRQRALREMRNTLMNRMGSFGEWISTPFPILRRDSHISAKTAHVRLTDLSNTLRALIAREFAASRGERKDNPRGRREATKRRY